MPNPHLSILVVDDAKFSSAMIGRALSQAGYQDVRFASSASEALQLLEQRPASVLLADWLMPEIDGLELTARVRQLDETADHYTYIILLTGKEGENVLGEAFDRGVDDFISKAAMNEQLVPRVYAADRLCNTLQRLLHDLRIAHATAVMGQTAHGDHFLDTKGEIQTGALRQDGQAPGALRSGPVIERTLIQRHLPGAGRQLAGHRRQQGALARTVGPQHTQHFAGVQLQIDATEHHTLAAADFQLFNPQHQLRPRTSR